MDSDASTERFSIRDPSTRCNHRQVAVRHYHWLVEVDFPAQVLHCSVKLTGSVLKDGCSRLVLDMCDLKVTSVVDTVTGDPLEYEISSPEGTFGSLLSIGTPCTTLMKAGSEFNVTISYETTPSCSAVQWLRCEQTAGKKQPYLYTQCQPIHARSMLPCMDTPSIKATYTAEVTVPSELTALMSAEGKGSEPHPTQSNRKVFKFEQKVPIPSYLMALVVGALESRRVGPRSKVWCEKEMIEQAEWEFSETDKILCAAEELAGPYLWGVYDLLILPPSFAYGGMENPCLTFLSPTVLSANTEAGDKSAACRLVAHEVSHSWTGNLVTNVSWEHFWLNEGWTTYLERKVIAKLYGEEERQLLYIGGWKYLGDTIEEFGRTQQLPLTAMVPRLSGIHPDDAFSRIPYEKGSLFLFYLESILGGPGSLDAFIKHYVASHKFANIDTESWRSYFLGYFKTQASEGVFGEVEWEKWLYGTGLPPYTPRYDTTLADTSEALAEKWTSTELTSSTLAQFSPKDLEMSSQCQRVFLDKLLQKAPLSVQVIQGLDEVYQLSKKQDSELKYRWQMLCLKSGYTNIFPLVVDFVSSQGRMKFVRPLYRSLFECGEEGRELALTTFASFRSFYQSVTVSQLEKDLQLRTAS